ncbi:MAG TPA: LysM domain-containing protein [Cellvibrionaceae bacterium]
MKKMIFAVLVLMTTSLMAWADDTTPFKESSPDEYVVREGDTLWGIAEMYLDSPWQWPEIWHANPEIDNPHLIFPGDLVRMVYIDGKPRLTVERTTLMVPASDATLRPTIRVLPIEEAIPAVPLDKIAAYLSRSRIVMPEDVADAPYMLAGTERRIITGKGDHAYARGDFSSDLENYGVFREEETFVDSETKEFLGVLAYGVGAVRIDRIDGDIAKVYVTRSEEELRTGDILLATQERSVDAIFYPSSPDMPIRSEILAVDGGVNNIGKLDVVVIKHGEREGLQVGNILAVYQRGEQVNDPIAGKTVQLPDERVGLLMIFRTFEKLSFAIMMEAERPIAVGDRLLNP